MSIMAPYEEYLVLSEFTNKSIENLKYHLWIYLLFQIIIIFIVSNI